MAQTTVWLVPDFLGSNMYFVGAHGGSKKVWLDLSDLGANGFADELRLPLQGGQTTAGSMVDFATFSETRFTDYIRRLIPGDWRLVIWSYDWRGGAQTLGSRLASAIQSNGTQPGGHRLLGLGYGGLVACAAYGTLVDRQQQQLITRVVTIGAPLAGTYTIPQTWLFLRNSYNRLQATQPEFTDVVGLPTYPFAMFARSVRTFTTWPSTYDLLPDPTAWDDPGDQYRAQLWQPSNWAGAVIPPDPALMQQSQTGFRAWINAGNRWPPAGVLVCGVGTGRQGPWRLALPSPNAAAQAERYRRGGLFRTGLLSAGLRSVIAGRILCPSVKDPVSYSAIGAILNQQYLGDGVATPQSQCRPGVQYVSCPADHFALPSDPVIRNNLLAMLSGPGLPAGPLDAETLPDWPSYRPDVVPWGVGSPVPELPRG